MFKSIRKSPWIFVVLPLLPLLLLLLFFGSRYLNEPGNIPLALIQCPDIFAGCSNEAFGIRFEQPPHVMKPFKVSIQASNADEVHISFAMQGMPMGLNRYRLIKQADSSWEVEVTLPICVQGRSHWVAQIELKAATGLKHYQFEFEALR